MINRLINNKIISVISILSTIVSAFTLIQKINEPKLDKAQLDKILLKFAEENGEVQALLWTCRDEMLGDIPQPFMKVDKRQHIVVIYGMKYYYEYLSKNNDEACKRLYQLRPYWKKR